MPTYTLQAGHKHSTQSVSLRRSFGCRISKFRLLLYTFFVLTIILDVCRVSKDFKNVVLALYTLK